MKRPSYYKKGAVCLGVMLGAIACNAPALAQETASQIDTQALLSDIRWKTEQQVREKLGDPESVRGPIGTHASYQLWNYPDYSVAFANNRVFHLFDKNSLHKLELNENRGSE